MGKRRNSKDSTARGAAGIQSWTESNLARDVAPASESKTVLHVITAQEKKGLALLGPLRLLLPLTTISLALLLSFLTLYFAFGHLNGSIAKTDESLHAKVVQEIWQSGNWHSPTIEGQPYFRKPPLKMWLSLLAVELFNGQNFSYRILDGLSGVGLVLLTVFFGKWLFGSWLAGIISALFLISSPTLITGAHGIRRATQDALLLFLSIGVFALLWRWFELTKRGDDSKKSRQALFWAGVLSGLACLTKNVAGYVPAAIFTLFILARYQLKPIGVRYWRGLPWLALPALAIPLAYFLPHFIFSPGAFEQYFMEEVVNRAVVGVHNSTQPLYYFNILFVRGHLFTPWVLVLGLCWGLWNSLKDRENFLFLLFWAITPVVVFSLLSSRLSWYIAISFPAFALLVGGLLFDLARFAIRQLQKKRVFGVAAGLTGIFLALTVVTPLPRSLRQLVLAVERSAHRLPLDFVVDDILQEQQHLTAVYGPVFNHNRLYASRVEKFYLDRLKPNLTFVEDADNMAQLQADFVFVPEKDLSSFLAADSRVPTAYSWLPPYHTRKEAVVGLSYQERSVWEHFTPTFQRIIFADVDYPSISGMGTAVTLLGRRVRPMIGRRATIVLGKHSFYCRFGSRNSLTVIAPQAQSPLPVSVHLNEQLLFEDKLSPSSAHQISFDAPASAWSCDKSVMIVSIGQDVALPATAYGKLFLGSLNVELPQ